MDNNTINIEDIQLEDNGAEHKAPEKPKNSGEPPASPATPPPAGAIPMPGIPGAPGPQGAIPPMGAGFPPIPPATHSQRPQQQTAPPQRPPQSVPPKPGQGQKPPQRQPQTPQAAHPRQRPQQGQPRPGQAAQHSQRPQQPQQAVQKRPPNQAPPNGEGGKTSGALVSVRTPQQKRSSQSSPQAGAQKGGLVRMQGQPGNIPTYQGDAGGALSTQVKKTNTAKPSEGGGKARIGEQLVERGMISEDQLNVALQEKKLSGKMIGSILVELGFIEEATLTSFLAESSGHEVFDPKATIFDGQALEKLPKEEAIKYQILPVSISDDELVVATADPYNIEALDRIRRYYERGVSIKPLVTTPTVLSEAIDAAYGYASNIEDILKELEDGQVNSDVSKLTEEDAYTHPIVRLVNMLLFDAVKMGASDLHFEPEENFLRLRYRVDGVLFTAHILHRQHWQAISQRIKIMSGMNIADKLTPQDGRFPLNVGGREADFRVSSLPTVFGENIVMRVLDKSASIMPLANLGFSPENLEKIKASQSKPEGIIIVTGPTGSGKTTSLYSMLDEINDVEVNIQTLEDPVEYSLPMIRQTHVKEGVLDFADGIKALLRQDPDIIFIGEVRDKTTAEMALKAAMTGHQVYTTLHTNDSFGAIPRILDLGLKPGMIAGAIVSVFAQRLGRRLCEVCKEEYIPNEYECIELLDVDPANPPTIYQARAGGCGACKGLGYKGRVAIVEILLFDDDMNELVAANATKAELRKMAFEKGFKDMRDDAIMKIKEGILSLDAASKVVSLKR